MSMPAVRVFVGSSLTISFGLGSVAIGNPERNMRKTFHCGSK